MAHNPFNNYTTGTNHFEFDDLRDDDLDPEQGFTIKIKSLQSPGRNLDDAQTDPVDLATVDLGVTSSTHVSATSASHAFGPPLAKSKVSISQPSRGTETAMLAANQ